MLGLEGNQCQHLPRCRFSLFIFSLLPPIFLCIILIIDRYSRKQDTSRLILLERWSPFFQVMFYIILKVLWWYVLPTCTYTSHILVTIPTSLGVIKALDSTLFQRHNTHRRQNQASRQILPILDFFFFGRGGRNLRVWSKREGKKVTLRFQSFYKWRQVSLRDPLSM